MESPRTCPNCRAFISRADRVCPYCEFELAPPKYAPPALNPRGLISNLFPENQPVTKTILTVNVLFYILTALASVQAGQGSFFDIDSRVLYRFGAAWPPAIYAGQYWRLITAGLLHGGIMHILFNSWALMDVGAHAEEIYGPRRMFTIYVFSTVTGFMASTIFTGSLSVGASAGLFGLLGAMVAIGMHSKSSEASMIKAFYLRWTIYGLLMGFLPFFRIDNAAHIGGFLGGFGMAWLAGVPRPWNSALEKAWSVASAIALGITLIALFKMFQFLMLTKDA